MSKSFIFLLTIIVCLLGSVSAQTEPNSQTNDSVLTKPVNASEGSATLPASVIAGEISEARRLLSSRQTSGMAPDRVTLAAFDPETSQTTIVSLPKKDFLTSKTPTCWPPRSWAAPFGCGWFGQRRKHSSDSH